MKTEYLGAPLHRRVSTGTTSLGFSLAPRIFWKQRRTQPRLQPAQSPPPSPVRSPHTGHQAVVALSDPAEEFYICFGGLAVGNQPRAVVSLFEALT